MFFLLFFKNCFFWEPKYIDIGSANLKAVKEVFFNKDIKIITCLFHLLQCWWRKAGNLGLRKKKYINETRLMLFNFELLPFMNIEDTRNYYNLV